MAALQALAAFTAVLRGLPVATIAPGHIGLARPAAAADLPAIVLSLADAHEATIGLGNLVQLSEVEATRWASTSGRRVKGQLCVELRFRYDVPVADEAFVDPLPCNCLRSKFDQKLRPLLKHDVAEPYGLVSWGRSMVVAFVRRRNFAGQELSNKN